MTLQVNDSWKNVECRIKHLEFIQYVITRMNSNSFLIKGWTITLVSALFALAAQNANLKFVLVSYIAIPAFWILDGFYISQERQYRELYKTVTESTGATDFSMNASGFNAGSRTWISGIFSTTLIIFYGISVVVTLVVMYLIK